MSPLLIAATTLLGIFLCGMILAALSGKTEPDTERRTRMRGAEPASSAERPSRSDS